MVKRIIVGCDGTWLNSDNGVILKSYWPWGHSINQVGTLETPSNVTRLCRALQPRAPSANGAARPRSDEPLQLVDYEPGIGTANNFWDHYINGGTAMSIGENVGSGYQRISANWEPGDEIFLIGFSRGSFIARSIASMIRTVGLLNKTGVETFYDIFQDWENQNQPSYHQRRYPGMRFDDATDTTPCSYAAQLHKDGLTTLDVRIKAIACFDTVGSLGIPSLGIFPPSRSYAFVNTEVLPNVDNCFHALALDEFRTPFSPTLWELPDDRVPGPGVKNPCTLRQCWFAGEHGNIGGSTDDAELPNITLAWMTEQLRPFLDFDPDYLEYCVQINRDYYIKSGKTSRQWAMGFIPNPATGIQRLSGRTVRTPGRYCRINPMTGAAEKKRLRNTNEAVHPSVRIRRWNKKLGHGIEDQGFYQPTGLKGYELVGNGSGKEEDPKSQGWTWNTKDDRPDMAGKTLVITEEVMVGVEIQLLDARA